MVASLSACAPTFLERVHKLNQAGKHEEAVDLILSTPSAQRGEKLRKELEIACQKLTPILLRKADRDELRDDPYARRRLLARAEKCGSDAVEVRNRIRRADAQIAAVEAEVQGVRVLMRERRWEEANDRLSAAPAAVRSYPELERIEQAIVDGGYGDLVARGVDLLERKRLKPAERAFSDALGWREGTEAEAGLLLVRGVRNARRGRRRVAFDELSEGLRSLGDVQIAKRELEQVRARLVKAALAKATKTMRARKLTRLAAAANVLAQAGSDAGETELSSRVAAARDRLRAQTAKVLGQLLKRQCADDRPVFPGLCLWLVAQARCAGVSQEPLAVAESAAATSLEAHTRRTVAVRAFDLVNPGSGAAGELERRGVDFLENRLPHGAHIVGEATNATIFVILRLTDLRVSYSSEQSIVPSRYVARVERRQNPDFAAAKQSAANWQSQCGPIEDNCARYPLNCDVASKYNCDIAYQQISSALASIPEYVEQTYYGDYEFVRQTQSMRGDAIVQAEVVDLALGRELLAARFHASDSDSSFCDGYVHANDVDGNSNSNCSIDRPEEVLAKAYEGAVSRALSRVSGALDTSGSRYKWLADEAEKRGDVLAAIDNVMAFLESCKSCPGRDTAERWLRERSFPGVHCENLAGMAGAKQLRRIDAALARQPRRKKRSESTEMAGARVAALLKAERSRQDRAVRTGPKVTAHQQGLPRAPNPGSATAYVSDELDDDRVAQYDGRAAERSRQNAACFSRCASQAMVQSHGCGMFSDSMPPQAIKKCNDIATAQLELCRRRCAGE